MCKKPFPSPCRSLPRRRPRGAARGFSLIELLIAVSLFAVLVVGILAMNSAYIKYNRNNKYYSTAVQLAENGIEECMRLPYAALEGKNDTIAFGQPGPYANYARSIEVQDYTTVSCTIVSRAAWREGGGTNMPTGAGRWPIQITVVRTAL